jgi:transcriptional regulator with XRE-family HTH domain
MPRLRVREIAESQNMNLSQLQRKADIAVRTARRYWFNTRSGNVTGEPLEELSLEVLGRIARALEVSVKDLIDDRLARVAAMGQQHTTTRAEDEATGMAATVPALRP